MGHNFFFNLSLFDLCEYFMQIGISLSTFYWMISDEVDLKKVHLHLLRTHRENCYKIDGQTFKLQKKGKTIHKVQFLWGLISDIGV